MKKKATKKLHNIFSTFFFRLQFFFLLSNCIGCANVFVWNVYFHWKCPDFHSVCSLNEAPVSLKASHHHQLRWVFFFRLALFLLFDQIGRPNVEHYNCWSILSASACLRWSKKRNNSMEPSFLHFSLGYCHWASVKF